MMNMRHVFLLLILASAFASSVSLPVFAVTTTGEGMAATLVVEVKEGNGDVSISIADSVVGPDTQESVVNAIKAASDLAKKDKEKYDFLVKIESPASRIDGPSAGLPIALAVYSLLSGKQFPEKTSGTGQITPDGRVLPVGKVFEKAEKAHELGIKTFLIPAGERNVVATVEEEVSPGVVQQVTKQIDIVAYAKKNWDMNIYEVSTLSDAVKIVFEGNIPEINIPPSQTLPKKFTPPYATLNKSKPFEKITNEMISRLKDLISEAENCYSSKKDIKTLLSSGKSLLETAEKMYKRNYFYTAANFAFLGIVDVRMYILLCEHPSMESTSSLAFKEFYDSVVSRAEALERNLDNLKINKGNVEWIGAARDRYIRAESRLGSLGNYEGVSALRALVSADEWLNAAERFAEIGRETNGEEIAGLDVVARTEIISLEDAIAVYGDVPPEVQERKSWAKEAFNRGWYYTAAVEAASARGLLQGYMVSKSGDPVSNASRVVRDENAVSMWGELYYNHAMYYYSAAVYYTSAGEKEKAAEMAKTALQIYFMAKEVDSVTNTVFSAPVVHYVVKKKVDFTTYLLFATTLFLVSVLLLVIILRRKRKPDYEYWRKIRELERELRKLEKNPEKNKKRIATIKRLLGRYRKKLSS